MKDRRCSQMIILRPLHAMDHLKHFTCILANLTDAWPSHFLNTCGHLVDTVRKKKCGVLSDALRNGKHLTFFKIRRSTFPFENTWKSSKLSAIFSRGDTETSIGFMRLYSSGCLSVLLFPETL